MRGPCTIERPIQLNCGLFEGRELGAQRRQRAQLLALLRVERLARCLELLELDTLPQLLLGGAHALVRLRRRRLCRMQLRVARGIGGGVRGGALGGGGGLVARLGGARQIHLLRGERELASRRTLGRRHVLRLRRRVHLHRRHRRRVRRMLLLKVAHVHLTRARGDEGALEAPFEQRGKVDGPEEGMGPHLVAVALRAEAQGRLLGQQLAHERDALRRHWRGGGRGGRRALGGGRGARTRHGRGRGRCRLATASVRLPHAPRRVIVVVCLLLWESHARVADGLRERAAPSTHDVRAQPTLGAWGWRTIHRGARGEARARALWLWARALWLWARAPAPARVASSIERAVLASEGRLGAMATGGAGGW